MTKTEAHGYAKFNAHLDKTSYIHPRDVKRKERAKPTLADHNGNLAKFRKDIRAFYKDRL